MDIDSKLIKVLYNNGKCYKCDGSNLQKLNIQGHAKCLDCCIDIVVFDVVTVKEYKFVFSLK